MRQIARSMATRGYHVHVLTRGRERDRVNFEDSVWVHRVRPLAIDLPRLSGVGRIPSRIWNYAATMAQEIERIADRRPVDAVYAPLSDCEGLGVLNSGRFPLITSLQTPLRFSLDYNFNSNADKQFMADLGEPMLMLEKHLIEHSAGVHAMSSAIVTDIEKAYRVSLQAPRLAVDPLGLDDWSAMPIVPPPALPEGTLRILFVGRLEPRKGIDVLLEAAKALLPERKHVHLDIVGSDPFAGDDERSYRVTFERDAATAALRGRIRFHGEVTDETLRGFYRACDIFIAPSHYELLGLVLIEAMMFAKPVIGCRAGGMPDIIEAGETGLLAEPGDRASLQACLEQLIDDGSLRRKMGAAGRRRYEDRFTPDRMTDALINLVSSIGRSWACEPPSPTIAHRASSREDEPLKSSPGSVVSSTREASVGRVTRVTLVSSIIACHDAVSAAVPHTIEVLRGSAQFELSVLTAFNDFPGTSAYIVNGLGALLLHPAFITADLLIYHFGIYHPFFDALIAAEGRARQIVAFHNVTPVKLASPEQEPVIEASFRQSFNLRHADRIWCMSEVNAAELAARGFDPHRIDMIPLAVERPPYARLAAKKGPQVELLFVRRIVRSKEVLDLIEAVDLARGACEVPFRLRIAGSLEFSDAAYVARIHQEIAERCLSCVQFLGTVEDEALFALYHTAHVLAIPSYHDGFGVSVIEALRSGCIPVGYAAHNLPNVAARLGRMVPTGDREQLAMALTQVIAGVARSADRPDEPLLPLDCGMMSRYAFDKGAHAHAAQFSAKRIGNEMLRSISGVLDAPAPPRWTERSASNLVGGNVQF